MSENKPTTANLVAVNILNFRGATRDITFDVYLKLADNNFAHIFSRTTGLDYKRLAQYIHKGVKELYIQKADLLKYQEFIAVPAQKIFEDPGATQEKKIATLLNMTEQNISELFVQMDIDEKTADQSRKLVSNYVEVMTENPQSLAIILKLVSHGEYLYYHSIAVAIFSMFIAKASGQFNKRTLEIVGLGGFLHDIGRTQLPKEITDSPTELTPEQWKEMRKHPKIGLKMIEKTANIPDEVRYIVYQHHETPAGTGYPNAIRAPVIYYPSKIVSIADSFSALISNRPFRPAYSVEEAIKIMKSETGKFDRELLDILSRIFLKQSQKMAA